MKTIRDSIHGHIQIEGVALELLDTARVQRLRRIRQLGTTHLVYPTANHTRFEHSIGVYYLADRLLDSLDIEQFDTIDNIKDTVRAAALLHDIGHGPFSHNTEEVIEHYTGKSHTDIQDLLTENEIEEILRRHDINPLDVLSIINGHGIFGQLLSSELDVDRMDYLTRDAYHTGVQYGSIDYDRLIKQLEFDDSTLVLGEGGLQAAESLLTARALMFPSVYGHHTARISEMMVRRTTDKLISSGEISAENLRFMDDHDLVMNARNSTDNNLINRLDRRDLYKRSIWVPIKEIPERIIDCSYDQVLEHEKQIAETAGVDSNEVIIDIPSNKKSNSAIPVTVGGDVRELTQESPLIGALQGHARNLLRFGIYTTPENTSLIAETANNVLNLGLDANYIRDDSI